MKDVFYVITKSVDFGAGASSGDLQAGQFRFSRCRRLLQDGQRISLVWFSDRYVSRPAMLNARVNRIQNTSLGVDVRLGHAWIKAMAAKNKDTIHFPY